MRRTAEPNASGRWDVPHLRWERTSASAVTRFDPVIGADVHDDSRSIGQPSEEVWSMPPAPAGRGPRQPERLRGRGNHTGIEVQQHHLVALEPRLVAPMTTGGLRPPRAGEIALANGTSGTHGPGLARSKRTLHNSDNEPLRSRPSSKKVSPTSVACGAMAAAALLTEHPPTSGRSSDTRNASDRAPDRWDNSPDASDRWDSRPNASDRWDVHHLQWERTPRTRCAGRSTALSVTH